MGAVGINKQNASSIWTTSPTLLAATPCERWLEIGPLAPWDESAGLMPILQVPCVSIFAKINNRTTIMFQHGVANLYINWRKEDIPSSSCKKAMIWKRRSNTHFNTCFTLQTSKHTSLHEFQRFNYISIYFYIFSIYFNYPNWFYKPDYTHPRFYEPELVHLEHLTSTKAKGPLKKMQDRDTNLWKRIACFYLYMGVSKNMGKPPNHPF